MAEILRQNANKLTNGILLHCYSDSGEIAKEYLKLGAYFSFGGVITFKNAKNADEIINLVPNEKILIETDSPYLSPEPFRGRRNTPANVRFVAQKIADVKGISVKEMEEIIEKNTKMIFNIK